MPVESEQIDLIIEDKKAQSREGKLRSEEVQMSNQSPIIPEEQ